jgi:hypothetical protein
MKTIRRHWITLIGIFGGGLVVVVTALTALSQPAPVLTITPLGTNQLLITITNAGAANYELWTTPVLADQNYPWTLCSTGALGQSNFTINAGPYPAGFYRALLDTNAIPLWEAADPNNPSLGILAVTIDNPTNGMVLQ